MAEIQSNLVDLTVVYSKLNAQLDENITRLNAGAVAVENYNKKISTVPSQFQKALVDIKQKTDAVATSTNSLMQAEKKANQERVKELQLQKQREVAIDKYNNQLAKEEAKLASANNAYNRLQTELNKLTVAYQNLAVRQAQGATLTKAEAQQMDYLQKRIQSHDKTLKAVDATMGKYQRNVGNYGSAFNPLQNSINQLGREMPAFANSVQTGFMAISNNLPVFFDAMQQVINQNKQLQAEGKPTKSVLSQLAGSLFSFQTLLSVGVTLLTVYGKEMVAWASSLWGASEALEELNKNQKKFNESKTEGKKASVSEVVELEKYRTTMRNSNLPLVERMIALKQLRNQFPFYFKDLKDEQMLNGDISKQLRLLNSDLEKKNILEKATEINVANKQKLIDLKEEFKSNTDLIASSKEAVKIAKERLSEGQKSSKQSRELQVLSQNVISAENQLNFSLRNKIKLNNDILKYEKAIATNALIINNYKTDTIRLEYTEEEQGNKRIARKKKEKEADEDLLFGTEAWLNAQISAFEQTRSKTAQSTEAYKELTGAIQYYQKWLETLIGSQKKSNEETEKTVKYGTIDYYEKLINALRQQQQAQVDNNQEFAKIESQIKFYQDLINGIKGVSEETEKATEKNTAYFDSFIDSFSSESGFSKTLDLFKDGFKLLKEDGATAALAISEAFQEAFNTIANASQANFEAEYLRLEMQKEISLKFAGDSATAREEIERQAEEKRKAIARREAEAQKRLAIFNIVTNTAQAIIASLAKTPAPAGIPFAVATGILGAAQLAIVASQQIPQFWMGGEHDGGLMMVNDGKGSNYRETIVTPDGKIEKPTGRNVVMNRPKGTQIFTHDQWNEVINKQLSSAGIQPMRGMVETISQQNSLTTEDFNAGISKLAKSLQSNKGGNTQVYLNNKPINTDYFKGKNV